MNSTYNLDTIIKVDKNLCINCDFASGLVPEPRAIRLWSNCLESQKDMFRLELL